MKSCSYTRMYRRCSHGCNTYVIISIFCSRYCLIESVAHYNLETATSNFLKISQGEACMNINVSYIVGEYHSQFRPHFG